MNREALETAIQTVRDRDVSTLDLAIKTAIEAYLAALSQGEGNSRDEVLEEAALTAYSVPAYVASFEPDERGQLQPGSPYDRGRYDAAAAIRALKSPSQPQGGGR